MSDVIHELETTWFCRPQTSYL